MHNPISDLFKIGITTNIKERLRKIQCESGCEIEVVQRFRPENAKKAERELHSKYKEKRGFGEWFSLSLEDVENIYAQINSPLNKSTPDFIANNYEPTTQDEVNGVNEAYRMMAERIGGL